MKLSNAIIYRSMFPVEATAETIEQAMQAAAFVPCSPSQESSQGWVPPREKNGALLEAVDGQWIAKLMIETKGVPASVLRKKLDERCEQIETATGRKPGRKERKDMKEDVLQELLPMAFPKTSAVDVWIDTKRGVIVLNTSSQSKADAVATALVRSVEGIALSMFNTLQAPGALMTRWLLEGEGEGGFDLGRDLELQATDETRAKVKYTNHPLDVQEIKDHITQGRRPVKLAVTWEDRVSFTLTEGMSLRSMTFLEGTQDAVLAGNDKPADNFDADVAISTGETAQLIAALVSVLGGEAQLTLADAKAEDGEPAAMPAPATTFQGEGADPMIEAARALVVREQKASISLVQRQLQIGYNRAAALVEALERAGAVSACNSVGVRSVLVTA